jgi:adenosine/AMP kinase
MKGYKTWEAVKMLSENPELKFESEDNELNIKQTLFVNELDYLEMNNEGCNNDIAGNMNVKSLWALVQQPVNVMDAIKAYHEGQNIYCILNGETYVYEASMGHKCIGRLDGYTLDDDSDEVMTTYELLNGTWYIGEPNE